ncbi:MAG: sulfatase [Aggregatilineales bacterium]
MQDSHPNFIYIVCHDLGKHLGSYGVNVLTPNLDRFAKNGALFTQSYCSSPACSPSRGCAMTGQYAHTNGLMGLVNNGWSLPEETMTIVDHLNSAGYETVHFGLQHERAYAEQNRYQIEGNHYSPDDYINRPKDWVENVVDDAITYLEKRRSQDTPFYLNIGTIEVHSSRWQGGLEDGHPQNRSINYGIDPSERVDVPNYVPDIPQIRQGLGRFQGAIRYLDVHLQRLFDAVERLGYSENTLIIFTTDHGIANMRAKTWLYDRGVEIALMLQMPGTIPAGIVIDDLIPNIDLVPTILEAAGVTIPDSIQGRSFWKKLIGETYSPHDYIITERNWHDSFDPMRAVRTKQYHYIRNFDRTAKKAWLPHDVPTMNESYSYWYTELWPPLELERPQEELYDTFADPEEINNLADNDAYHSRKSELSTILDQWMQDTDDPILKGAIPDKLNGWYT